MNSSGSRLLTSCLNMRKQLNRTMGEVSLSHREFLVLRFIGGFSLQEEEQRQNIRAALLSDTLNMSRPAVSRILNALDNRGFITRSVDKSDRRGVFIEITEKGRTELKNVSGEILKNVEDITKRFGEEETESLIKLLEQLSVVLKDIADERGGNKYE